MPPGLGPGPPRRGPPRGKPISRTAEGRRPWPSGRRPAARPGLTSRVATRPLAAECAAVVGSIRSPAAAPGRGCGREARDAWTCPRSPVLQRGTPWPALAQSAIRPLEPLEFQPASTQWVAGEPTLLTGAAAAGPADGAGGTDRELQRTAAETAGRGAGALHGQAPGERAQIPTLLRARVAGRPARGWLAGRVPAGPDAGQHPAGVPGQPARAVSRDGRRTPVGVRAHQAGDGEGPSGGVGRPRQVREPCGALSWIVGMDWSMRTGHRLATGRCPCARHRARCPGWAGCPAASTCSADSSASARPACSRSVVRIRVARRAIDPASAAVPSRSQLLPDSAQAYAHGTAKARHGPTRAFGGLGWAARRYALGHGPDRPDRGHRRLPPWRRPCRRDGAQVGGHRKGAPTPSSPRPRSPTRPTSRRAPCGPTVPSRPPPRARCWSGTSPALACPRPAPMPRSGWRPGRGHGPASHGATQPLRPAPARDGAADRGPGVAGDPHHRQGHGTGDPEKPFRRGTGTAASAKAGRAAPTAPLGPGSPASAWSAASGPTSPASRC